MNRSTNDRTPSCNATEMMLRSGRGAARAPARGRDQRAPALRRPEEPTEFFAERIELGLIQVGRRLDAMMSVLTPYRTDDGDLQRAYTEAHDALGDLAATYTWVTLGSRPAPPAPPARRRRPWGG